MDRLRPLVAGNWKMNGTKAELVELDALKAGLRGMDIADVAICPPTTLISRAAVMVANSRIMIGGQDCHTEASGAYTGDISAEMIADAGGRLIIVGHSERRQGHHEGDEIVRAKVAAVWRARLLAVVCVGETALQRQGGKTLPVLTEQLIGSIPAGADGRNLVVAYEPVWAIGTGVTPSADEIGQAHAHIRGELVGLFGEAGSEVRILYGGSVKPDNAAEIFQIDGVNGALVGGASLKAKDFLAIVAALR